MTDITVIVLEFSFNYAIFGFAGFIANAALLIMLFRARKSESLFNKTLASLAVANLISDVCFAVSGTLFTYQTLAKIWEFENMLILVRLQFANRAFIAVSLSHIVFIAVQRFVAVYFPFRFKRIFTTKLTWMILVLIWALPLAATVLFHYVIRSDNDPDVPVAYSIILLGVILTICYTFILIRLIIQRKLTSAMTINNNPTSDTKHKFKLFFNSIGVTFLFLILMLPFAISTLEADILGKWRMLFSSFIAIKTLVDPTVYFFIARCSQCSWTKKRNEQIPLGGVKRDKQDLKESSRALNAFTITTEL